MPAPHQINEAQVPVRLQRRRGVPVEARDSDDAARSGRSRSFSANAIVSCSANPGRPARLLRRHRSRPV